MNDDWRLQIDLEDDGIGGEIADHLRASELEHDLAVEFDRRVIVSHEGERIFLYAGDREPARPGSARGPEVPRRRRAGRRPSTCATGTRYAEDWEDPDRGAADHRRRAGGRARAADADRGRRDVRARRARRVRGAGRVPLPRRGARLRREARGRGPAAGAPLALHGRRRRRRGRRQGAGRADPRRGARRQQGHRRGLARLRGASPAHRTPSSSSAASAASARSGARGACGPSRPPRPIRGRGAAR